MQTQETQHERNMETETTVKHNEHNIYREHKQQGYIKTTITINITEAPTATRK